MDRGFSLSDLPPAGPARDGLTSEIQCLRPRLPAVAFFLFSWLMAAGAPPQTRPLSKQENFSKQQESPPAGSRHTVICLLSAFYPRGFVGPASGASPLSTAQWRYHNWEARPGQGGMVERVRLAWSRIFAGRAIGSGLFRSDTAGPLSERSELLAPPDLGRPEQMVAVCLRSRASRPGPR